MDRELAGLIANEWLEVDALDPNVEGARIQARRTALILALTALVPAGEWWAVVRDPSGLPLIAVLAEQTLFRVGSASEEEGFALAVERVRLSDEYPRGTVTETIEHDGAGVRRRSWHFFFDHADPLEFETQEYVSGPPADRPLSEHFARALARATGWEVST